MKWLKGLFIDNLGTKLMAFVLAMLLWIYLYNESTDSDEVVAVFEPKVEATELASWTAYDSEGRPLDKKIRLKLTGPKGELRGMSRKGIRCEPRFEKDLFTDEREGTFARDLSVDDLNLPENFRVAFQPSARITIRYVKYVTAKVRVALPPVRTDGQLRRDFTVASVEIAEPPGPDHLTTVRMPANRSLTEVRIKPVSVAGKFESFTVRAEPDLTDPDVRVREIVVRVTILPETDTLPLKVPLRLAGDPAVVGRLDVPPKMISVKVTGPKSEIAGVDRTNPGNTFYAVAIVDLTSVNPGDRGELKEIYCDIKDPRLKARLTVTVDPDQSVEYKVK